MNLSDYQTSEAIVRRDYSFYSLIMAAMRKADPLNGLLLKESFPDVWEELSRYSLLGGEVPDDI